VIAAPPFDTGDDHVITDCVFAFDVAETEVGAPGVVSGVTLAEEVEDVEFPAELVATTENV
jgi:hypothetical protein